MVETKASKGHGKKVGICSNNCKETGFIALNKKWMCRGLYTFNEDELSYGRKIREAVIIQNR